MPAFDPNAFDAAAFDENGRLVTVADLLTRALRRVNVLQAGQAPSAEDAADAFTVFDMMIGSWRLERLTIPFLQRTTWTITSSKGTLANPYTVGTGGDVNTPRPSLPNAIVVKYQDTSTSPTTEYRLTPLTDAAWQAIPQKNLTSPLPTNYYYSPTYASSLGSLYLWMVPTQANLQGILYAPYALQDYTATSDTILLPDGYSFALQENLAVALAPEWRENIPLDPELKESARQTKALLKMANVRMSDLQLDPAALQHRGLWYSIYSDGPV